MSSDRESGVLEIPSLCSGGRMFPARYFHFETYTTTVLPTCRDRYINQRQSSQTGLRMSGKLSLFLPSSSASGLAG